MSATETTTSAMEWASTNYSHTGEAATSLTKLGSFETPVEYHDFNQANIHREEFFLKHEFWSRSDPWESTGSFSEFAPADHSDVHSIESVIEENRLASDRSVLVSRYPSTLSNESSASREVNARLGILEQRLREMVPVRTEGEITEMEELADAIEALDRLLN